MRLIYKDVAVGADADAAVTGTGADSRSDLSLLPFDAGTPAIATLEPGLWRSGYSVYDGQDIGFWSTALSGSSGILSPAPTLTITFTESYTSKGIYFDFDVGTGDYCSTVYVRWYKGTALLASRTFQPNSASYFCEKTVSGYDKVVCTFRKTSKPYRRLKINAICFGVVRNFGGNELRSVRILEEVNPISTELASNSLDFTLESKNEDISYVFSVKQPIEAYDNENALLGAFYVDSSKRFSKTRYQVTCTDAVGVLGDSDFPEAMYAGKNAKELITDILDGHYQLEMDTDLQSRTVTGYLPQMTRREALQQVCFAIGAVADTSNSKAVKVFRLPAAVTDIPDTQQYTGASVETSAITTAVEVTAHTYTKGTGNNAITVGGVSYIHTTSVTRIENPKVQPSDRPNVVQITDATLVNASNVAEIAQRVFDYYDQRDTLQVKIKVDGETCGGRCRTSTPFGGTISGVITSMNLILSNTIAANIELHGVAEDDS